MPTGADGCLHAPALGPAAWGTWARPPQVGGAPCGPPPTRRRGRGAPAARGQRGLQGEPEPGPAQRRTHRAPRRSSPAPAAGSGRGPAPSRAASRATGLGALGVRWRLARCSWAATPASAPAGPGPRPLETPPVGAPPRMTPRPGRLSEPRAQMQTPGAGGERGARRDPDARQHTALIEMRQRHTLVALYARRPRSLAIRP